MKKRKSRKRKYQSLSPLKKRGRKRLGKFLVVDLESNDWKDLVVGGIYDGKKFYTFTTIAEFFDQLRSYPNYKVFAHFGGIFDFYFFLDFFGMQSLDKLDLIMRGSSVFSFKYGDNTFYDSCGILPFSLEKAAESFNVSHKKLKIDHSIRKVLNSELVTYLKHDCVALFESIEKFYSSPLISRANFKATLASQSLEVLRLYLKKPIPSIDNPKLDQFIRRSYAGGRTEIVKALYSSKDKTLRYYDFNSMYPKIMSEMEAPGRVIAIHKRIVKLGISDVVMESPPDIYLPVLWKKAHGKFFFPTGKFRGTFCGVEILYALELGYTLHKVYKTVEFENLGMIFREYILDLYESKVNSKNEGQTVVAKLLLNAGYGRIAIKREQKSLTIDDGREGLSPTDIWMGKYRLANKETNFDGFSNPAIGSMITAESRVLLHRTIKPIEHTVYYMDTDGFKTTSKLPTGKGLGELKLEDKLKKIDGEYRACFLLPKSYIFEGERKVLRKLKGFQKEFAASLNFQDYRKCLEGELKITTSAKKEISMNKPEWMAHQEKNKTKLVRIRSAIDISLKTEFPKIGKKKRLMGEKVGSLLKVVNNSDREIRQKYDKRKILEKSGEWETIPFTYAQIMKRKKTHGNYKKKNIGRKNRFSKSGSRIRSQGSIHRLH